nr:retroviral aspartyl protease [Tanacetum cinerariifolium]
MPVCWRLVCLPRVYDDVGCLLALVLFHALPLIISLMHTYTGRRSPGSSPFTFGFILEVGVGSVYISPPPYLAPAGLGMCCHLKSRYDVKVLVDASDVDHVYEVHNVKSKEKSESRLSSFFLFLGELTHLKFGFYHLVLSLLSTMPPRKDTLTDDQLSSFQDQLNALTTKVDAILNRMATQPPPPPPLPPPPPPPHNQPRPPKILLPNFDGSNPLDWIFQANNYFAYYSIPPAQRNEIAIHHLTSLHQAYGLAKLIEDKINLAKPRFPTTRTYTNPSPSTSTVAQLSNSQLNLLKSTPLLPAPPSPKPPLPFTRLSPEALQKRRAEGLCFRCPEKFHPCHKCNPPQFLLIVDNDDQPTTDDIFSMPTETKHTIPDQSDPNNPLFLSFSDAAAFGLQSSRAADLDKLAAIKSWPSTNSFTTLRAFLGLTG